MLVSAPDLNQWDLDIRVLDENHPIYKNQTFRLRMRFSDKYPIEAPECYFVSIPASTGAASQANGTSNGAAAGTANGPSQPTTARPIPLHPHVYTNGIICLDMLGTGWSPVHNVESICVSLQSMLSGNEKAERPEGDEVFSKRVKAGSSTRGIGFMYDDEKV